MSHEVLRESEGLVFQLMTGAKREEWAQWLRAPLLQACRTANADAVDKLLEAGVDATSRVLAGGDGRPLLHAAAHGGSERILAALLSVGACRPDIEFRPDDTGCTALQVVVRNGKREAARVLMAAGADVNGTLKLAIEGGHELLGIDLLRAGADPNDCEGGPSPLALACKRGGCAQLVGALLLKRADTGVDLGAGGTVLHAAARRGHVSTVKALLAGGLAVDVFDGMNETPLHCAAKNKTNCTAVIDTLVAAGADVGAQDDSEPCGRLASPLHTAVIEDNYEAALALLRHGADVDASFAGGERPLHLACWRLREDAAELLLRWGADERVVGYNGAKACQWLPTVAKIQAGGYAGSRLAKRARILALLARAPHDRAWRRRRFVVLCRAHPERLRLACGVEDDARAGDNRSGSPRSKAARQEEELSGAPCGEGAGEEECGGIRSFDRLAAWLMELPEAGVFRHIVGFL